MFGRLYKQYIEILARGHSAQARVEDKNSKANRPIEVPVSAEVKSFREIDDIATQLGNQYRGIGVFVGILGCAIIFLAVTPSGLQLHGIASMIIGTIEIALMLTMLGFVVYGTRSNLRQKWVMARRRAELVRYKDLRDSIEKLRLSMNATDSRNVSMEAHTILGGADGQASYNAKKHAQYERVTDVSDHVAWIGFLIALTGAALHLSPFHASWLIYLTAFLPSVVGAIHGVNSFLQVSSLAEDHGLMADYLNELLGRLDQLDKTKPAEVLELAEAIYQVLSNRDVQWVESTQKLGLRPA